MHAFSALERAQGKMDRGKKVEEGRQKGGGPPLGLHLLPVPASSLESQGTPQP